MRYFFYLFWFFIVFIGVTFASLNSHPVSINYYFNQSTVHLPILLLLTLITGTVLGSLAILPQLAKAKTQARRLKSKLRQLDLEVNNLRKIPIQDDH